MNIKNINLLCDPITKEKLILKDNKFFNMSGKEYQIIHGIPQLLKLTEKEKNNYAVNLFSKKASVYDKYQHLSFDTFKLNEEEVRNGLIDKLELGAGEQKRVLELSAGTGRDSVLIKKRLKKTSELFVQDISIDMLLALKSKFEEDGVNITQSNASMLPYKDGIFDAIYSFAGVGMSVYADGTAIMKEVVRVAKKGARIVIGGLSLAPWLYDTEFGKILVNHNTHYANKLDMSCLPVEARDVELSWILNGAGFCISFTVGEGEPEADFDFEIPGERGGSLRTRYYGKLEGVSLETKELAIKMREKLGISMYELMNNAIKAYAEKYN